MFIDQEKIFILDTLYMIDFSSVNIIIICEIRWAEKFYQKHVNAQIFIFLRGLKIDLQRLQKDWQKEEKQKWRKIL